MRVLVSLFSEYLQFNSYNYSNAVFLPEAGHSNQILTRNEVIEILRLGPILKVFSSFLAYSKCK